MIPIVRTVSISAARAGFAALIRQVEAGESVVLTRQGTPVAALLPILEYRRLQAGVGGFWSALQRFRADHHLAALAIEPKNFDGVRDCTVGRGVDL